MKNKNRKISRAISCILILQLLLLVFMNTLNLDFINSKNELKKTFVEQQEIFIKETIRQQQRRMLNSIRESWTQYIGYAENIELLLKDKEGNIIYTNGEDVVAFNREYMIMDKYPNGYCDIRYKNSNIIYTNMRPQWNKEEVIRILNIVAVPMRVFGGSENILIYDIYSGEIIASNTQKNSGPFVQNLFEDQHVVDKLMIRQDTEIFDNIVYSSTVKEGLLNYNKYPIGSLDRVFVEKVILPFETVGVDGEPMQIAIASFVKEKEIAYCYESTVSRIKQSVETMETKIFYVFAIFIISFILSVAMYAIFNIAIMLESKKRDDKDMRK